MATEMQRLFSIVFSVLLVCTFARASFAGTTLQACVVTDGKLLRRLTPGVRLLNFDKKNCATPFADPFTREHDIPSVAWRSYVVVWLENDAQVQVPLADAGIDPATGVKFFADGLLSTGTAQPIPTTTATGSTYTYFGLDVLKDIAHGKTVKMQISRAGATAPPPYVGVFRARKSPSKYSFAGTNVGLWIPAALFASNLKTTDTGIPFTALPVGLAFGGKVNVSNSFYFGGSVMANWLVGPGKDATGTADNSVNVRSGALGVLVDIGNYVYFGYAYGLDFRKGVPNPGNLFVFGVAPGLLQFVQAPK